MKTEVSQVNAITRVSGWSSSSGNVRLLAQVASEFVKSQVERVVVLTRIVRGRTEWTACKEEQSW